MNKCNKLQKSRNETILNTSNTHYFYTNVLNNKKKFNFCREIIMCIAKIANNLPKSNKHAILSK